MAVCAFANAVGLVTGWITAIKVLDLSTPEFVRGMRLLFTAFDVRYSLIKAASFGLVVTSVGCYFGFATMGGAVAVGPRVGRFALEAGHVYAELSEPGPSTLALGNVHRLSINGRADLIRLGSRSLGPNSMLAIYGEAGVARQLHPWYKPGSNAARRILPVDAGRSIAVFGFGLNLDHRLEQPLGFPSRIGWQLGWQLTASDRQEPGSTVNGLSAVAAWAGGGDIIMPERSTSAAHRRTQRRS
jgi:hypothetical protein